MSVHVVPAEDTDMDRIFELACLAFGRDDHMWNAMWPKHWTEKGRKDGAERMRHSKNTDPNTVYLKAVNLTSGEIMGMAKWNFYVNGASPPSAEVSAHYWDDPRGKEYFDKVLPLFVARRNEAVQRTGGNVVSLDILAIDPAHQRKGVGDALVKWGVKKADELGLESVVESSPFGRGLYAKNGFVFQEDCKLEVPEFPDHPPPEFAWMTRPKQTT
ncbi:GNAT family acetyltransferase like [Lecanosticta acicola]|uniref:GNAT family acetyltransferase like n=1 Tax=Lecanosticta acicola TaxID=111012 RepID=A0AAI8YUT8_9PEZI|nr:GNAT family acetyltransferase like [Lecanosticta acicola]